VDRPFSSDGNPFSTGARQMQQQQHAGEQQQLATNAHDAANSVMPFDVLSISSPRPAAGAANVISSNSTVDRSSANVDDDSDISHS
jgi:hypothetical protein